jgi:hypothetical protein
MDWLIEEGGDARLVRTDGDRALVDASRPFPVGSTLVGTETSSDASFRVKVRGCRRTDSGRFLVEGRFVNLSRDQRDRLQTD